VPRRPLSVAAVGLLGLVAWEYGGWDVALSALYGDAAGFAWRDRVLTRDVLHAGGRWLSLVVLVLLLVDAVHPLVGDGPPRERRLQGVAWCLLALVVVPALKRASATSCPWDLAAFGGSAPYVPHWRLGLVDGGPGRCFPSGHAVAAFAFYGVGHAWRRHRPRLASAWTLGVSAVGLVFGWAQLARGAHFASHVLWSAWWCWTLTAAAQACADAVRRRRRRRWGAALRRARSVRATAPDQA
jgi:membrane-associated PAP2 superfamily phosphatase